MDNPPRICFHDSTQELVLVLNFGDVESRTGFAATLQEWLTVTHPGVPGFFKLFRFTPIMSGSEVYEDTKKKSKEAFLKDPPPVGDFLSTINRLIAFIAPNDSQGLEPPNAEALVLAFTSREALTQYLRINLVDRP